LSEGARRSLSREDFAGRLKMYRDEALAQARALRQARGRRDRLTMEAEVKVAPAQSTELRVEGRRWHLTHGLHRASSAATPQMALRAFVRAIEKGDLEHVLRML